MLCKFGGSAADRRPALEGAENRASRQIDTVVLTRLEVQEHCLLRELTVDDVIWHCHHGIEELALFEATTRAHLPVFDRVRMSSRLLEARARIS